MGSAGIEADETSPARRSNPSAASWEAEASACNSPRSSPNRSAASSLDSAAGRQEAALRSRAAAAASAPGPSRRPAPTRRRRGHPAQLRPTADAFRQWWDRDDGPRTRLLEDAIAAQLIGSVLIIFAAMTLAMKIVFIIQLIVLLVQVTMAIASAVRDLRRVRPRPSPASSPPPGSSASAWSNRSSNRCRPAQQILEQAKKLLKLVRNGRVAEARRSARSSSR